MASQIKPDPITNLDINVGDGNLYKISLEIGGSGRFRIHESFYYIPSPTFSENNYNSIVNPL